MSIFHSNLLMMHLNEMLCFARRPKEKLCSINPSFAANESDLPLQNTIQQVCLKTKANPRGVGAV